LRHIKLPAINILRKNLKEIDLLGRNKEVHPVLTLSFSLPSVKEVITAAQIEVERNREKSPKLLTSQGTLPGNKRKQLLGMNFRTHGMAFRGTKNEGEAYVGQVRARLEASKDQFFAIPLPCD